MVVLEQVTQIGTKSGFPRDKLLVGLRNLLTMVRYVWLESTVLLCCDLCFGIRLALSRFLCTFAAGLLLCPQAW